MPGHSYKGSAVTAPAPPPLPTTPVLALEGGVFVLSGTTSFPEWFLWESDDDGATWNFVDVGFSPLPITYGGMTSTGLYIADPNGTSALPTADSSNTVLVP